MDKGFFVGAVLGAAAVAAYEMGTKAKNSMEQSKKKVKKKIEDIFD